MVKRGQLRGADIRFADATRVFLVGADMTRANLQGIYFYNAALRHADLMWADLREAFSMRRICSMPICATPTCAPPISAGAISSRRELEGRAA